MCASNKTMVIFFCAYWCSWIAGRIFLSRLMCAHSCNGMFLDLRVYTRFKVLFKCRNNSSIAHCSSHCTHRNALSSLTPFVESNHQQTVNLCARCASTLFFFLFLIIFFFDHSYYVYVFVMSVLFVWMTTSK